MTKRQDIDWTAIEAEYRAGTLSNRQIAERFGVSESAIRSRANKGKWVRSAHESAQPRAHLPVQEILPPIGREARPMPPAEARDVVDHAREIAARQLDELDVITSHVGELEELIEIETADDENGRRRAAMLKAISLPARALTLKTLTQALATMKDITGVAGGKKEEAKAKAKEAAKPGNRFAPPAAPRLAVDNTKG